MFNRTDIITKRSCLVIIFENFFSVRCSFQYFFYTFISVLDRISALACVTHPTYVPGVTPDGSDSSLVSVKDSRSLKRQNRFSCSSGLITKLRLFQVEQRTVR